MKKSKYQEIIDKKIDTILKKVMDESIELTERLESLKATKEILMTHKANKSEKISREEYEEAELFLQEEELKDLEKKEEENFQTWSISLIVGYQDDLDYDEIEKLESRCLQGSVDEVFEQLKNQMGENFKNINQVEVSSVDGNKDQEAALKEKIKTEVLNLSKLTIKEELDIEDFPFEDSY